MRVDEFKQAYMMCKPSKKEIALLTEYINSKPVDYDYTYDDIDMCRYGESARSRTVCFAVAGHAIVTYSNGVWGIAKTSKHYQGGNSGRWQDC